jgi:hypothetical protein
MNNIQSHDEFTKEFLAFTHPLLEAEYYKRGLVRKEGAGGIATDYDPVVMMRRIQIIEQGIKDGKVKLMFEELEKRGLTNHLYQLSEREDAMEFFEIWLLTLLANDKACLNDLGLLDFEKSGDLRTARLIEDETELLYRLLNIETMRKHPGVIQRVREEAAKMNATFFERMGRILKKPGIGPEHVYTETQRLLLICWASNFKLPEDKYLPPLCRSSDPAIADFVTKTLRINQISPGRIRKQWERLGLRKMRHIELRKPV